MKFAINFIKKDPWLIFGVFLLLTISFLILNSIAPFLFPQYFIYFLLALIVFVIFANVDFEIILLFKWQIYVLCIIFLIIPLVIGQVTRGAIRWIPIAGLTFQPSELVRPFLILFFAGFLSKTNVNMKRFIQSIFLLGLPALLILIQPSLGVTILTVVGYLGVLLASTFSKKKLAIIFGIGILCLPLVWLLMAPYQKQRVTTFLYPQSDPSGAGYNSIQAMISVGSGRFWGRGLGEGVQTQLSFLPERHTDFIFASVAEELGFVGALVLVFALFFLLYRISQNLHFTKNLASRCFVAGIFLTFFVQVLVHIGMNMGLFPVTGIPLPLISAGGSSLIASMIGLGLCVSARSSKIL
jgi:rod shape determining protein RodA